MVVPLLNQNLSGIGLFAVEIFPEQFMHRVKYQVAGPYPLAGDDHSLGIEDLNQPGHSAGQKFPALLKYFAQPPVSLPGPAGDFFNGQHILIRTILSALQQFSSLLQYTGVGRIGLKTTQLTTPTWLSVRDNHHMTELCSYSGCSLIKLAVNNDTHAYPFLDGDYQKISYSPSKPKPLRGYGKRIGVVFQVDIHIESLSKEVTDIR